jgi:hypothetical protein
MPERTSRQTAARDCGDSSVDAGRGPGQMGWYRFACRYVQGKTVLDVGCGTAAGLNLLTGEAKRAEGQDLDSRLARANVRICNLQEISPKSYDILVTIDVIEHVQDVGDFLSQLRRIARIGLFITTPNWTASRCQWPYHLREYTPREFFKLLSSYGAVTLFKGNPDGSRVYPVKYRRTYFAQNDLRTFSPTAFPARALNVVLPQHFRICSSNAAWVTF